MKDWKKEPLLHFLLLSVLIFAFYYLKGDTNESETDHVIVLEDGDIDRLLSNYTRNWNRLPDSATFRKIVEEELRSEILYREALRLNLDHNDEIIRRRMRQKLEFLIEDLAKSREVTEDSLLAFYQTHQKLFNTPLKLSFRQLYFSPDKRKDPSGDAQKSKSKLDQSSWESLKGDASHLSESFTLMDQEQIRQLFGDEFARSITENPDSGKSEVIASGYGIHLVQIDSIETPELLPFESIREKVIQEWKRQATDTEDARFYEEIRSKYEVNWRLKQMSEWELDIR